jgi:hydrogenase maturation protease
LNALPQKTLLVALGNPLSGDDGFGPLVQEQLQARADLKPAVTLVDAGTDLLNHIESFAGYDRVVLIDAILDPESKLGPPGRVAVVEESGFLSWSEASAGVHQISPLIGIKLFRTLYPEARTRIDLVGLFVDQLSHYPIYMTDDKIQEAVEIIHALLKTATNFTN